MEFRRWLSIESDDPAAYGERLPVWPVASEAQPPDAQGAEARQQLAENLDRGDRKFEAAAYRARARVPRHSPRPTPQQSGGAQIRAEEPSQ